MEITYKQWLTLTSYRQLLPLYSLPPYHYSLRTDLPLAPMSGLKSQDTLQKHFEPGNLQAQKGGQSSPFCGSRCQIQSGLGRSYLVVEAMRAYQGLIQS